MSPRKMTTLDIVERENFRWVSDRRRPKNDFGQDEITVQSDQLDNTPEKDETDVRAKLKEKI
jgi:hypothetical protein